MPGAWESMRLKSGEFRSDSSMSRNRAGRVQQVLEMRQEAEGQDAAQESVRDAPAEQRQEPDGLDVAEQAQRRRISASSSDEMQPRPHEVDAALGPRGTIAAAATPVEQAEEEASTGHARDQEQEQGRRPGRRCTRRGSPRRAGRRAWRPPRSGSATDSGSQAAGARRSRASSARRRPGDPQDHERAGPPGPRSGR